LKKRVLWIFPKSEDATSLWRGSGPMKHLAKRLPDVEFVQHRDDVNWDSFWGYDLIFMQRPASVGHKGAMQLAKRMGIKVWVDYDDDMFTVPNSNPASLVLGNKDLQRDIINMISMADVVSVSTEELRRKYSAWNQNVLRVPNAWNEEMFWYREPDKVARAKAVLWRGTRTHAEDLDEFLPQISRIARSHPDWKFVFIGGAYWKIHQAVPESQLTIFEPLEQTLFYETIYKLGAKIMMVPLANHAFNQSKSNIAWMEGTFCGSAVVCPDWQEWQRPGALNYNNPDQFEELMNIAMKPGMDLSKQAKTSWAHIQENLSLEKINSQRLDILKSLLGLR
jgi:hypothetical protein